MAKEKKARYIVELDLILETFQFHILEKRLEIAREISNACKSKMLDHLQLLKQNQEYQYWLKQPKSKERSNKLTELREQYDVSKTGAERIVKDMGKHYKQKKPKNSKNKQRVHLDSLVVQKIALAVWDSVSDYLFNPKTNKVHFKKFGQFNTIEGKNNESGLTYENSILYWNGLELKVHFPKKDQYLEKAMHDEIAYCRLIRKTIRGKVKYYLQLVMKGIPPQKREITEGTIKKGNRDKWIRSKRYWKQLYELKEICRRIAAKRKVMHNQMANKVLAMGNKIYCEKMNYKGLQKTKFGKRIGYKAPSLFLNVINSKLSYQGKTIQFVNTWKVKASQYCPFSNKYMKKKLSQRFHITSERLKIQRDCFSAWLIKNVNKAKTKVNRKKCLENFGSFYQAYKKTEESLRSQNKKYISSIGF